MPTKKTTKESPEKKPKKKAVAKKKGRGGGVKRWEPKTSYSQCTVKELRFLKELFTPENKFRPTLAHQAAYGSSYEVARSNGYLVFNRLKPIIDQWLEEEGLSEQALKKKLIDMINATETKFFPYMKKKKDGEEYSEEQIITEKVVNDNHTQGEMLKLAFKAKGLLSDKSTREVDQIDKLIEAELRKLDIMEKLDNTGQDTPS